ncbi:DUF3943 domain-containing protein [Thalassotalea sp. PLHSN55]|uniref:DUF3943 domain-containing protein n=1 Tax=Thalassotalea sp. PLHSN55 TaxID=3435888 RepID=UPI003F84E37C
MGAYQQFFARVSTLTKSSISQIFFIFLISFVQPNAFATEKCTEKECISETDLEPIYRTIATNSAWESKDVADDFYQSPYQVSIFNPKNGEDKDRLWSQSKAVFTYGFGVIGIIALLPEDVSNWERGEIFGKWGENVKEGPVWDRDGLGINLVGHGYFGGVYYQVARKSGYRQWDAFMYSVMMSTFYWEYGIEAFAEVPSIQDLVVTPVIGWAYGEWAYQTEQSIRRDGGTVLGSETLGDISLAVLDPIDSISTGVNNMFGHEVFIAGTGYLNAREVPIGVNGDSETLMQLGVTYQFGSGKKIQKKHSFDANAKYTSDPVDTSIIGVSVGYGRVNLDDAWAVSDDNFSAISLGLYFSKSFSARLSYDKGVFAGKVAQEKVNYENYNVNAQYYFNTDSKLRPYIIGGFGEMMRDEDREKKTFQTHLGLGLHYQINRKLALQVDAKQFYSGADKTSDTAITSSLVYRFASGE